MANIVASIILLRLAQSDDVGSDSTKSRIMRRTGMFSDIKKERCDYYAEFMNDLTRAELDTIFWTLLLATIVILSVVVYLTQRAHRVSQLEPDEEKGLDPDVLERQNFHYRKKLFYVSIFCFLLALLTTIMGAFAGLAIAWCHGEDLINFYWSLWTLIDISSVIAILGTILNQWYQLSDDGIKQPAWNFALGTPVPVMAAMMHCFGFKFNKAWKSFWGKREVRKRDRAAWKSAAESRTTSNRNSMLSTRFSLSQAKIIDFSADGKCIMEIELPQEMLRGLPEHLQQQSQQSTRPQSPHQSTRPSTSRSADSAAIRPAASSSAPERPQFFYPRYDYMNMEMPSRLRGESVVDDETAREVGGSEEENVKFELPPIRRREDERERESERDKERRRSRSGGSPRRRDGSSSVSRTGSGSRSGPSRGRLYSTRRISIPRFGTSRRPEERDTPRMFR